MEQRVLIAELREWPSHLLGKEVVVSGILMWDADLQKFTVEKATWAPAPEE